ncbi:MAG TPA: AgmX/PglI C-terminal domain-containing protein [Polyangiaceae bacterium]|nr:AgmX/PglI C-terminal domain-containing protein [Polyangiaceae bacterium]
MRIAHSFSTLMMLAALLPLAAVACAGGTPAPVAASDATAATADSSAPEAAAPNKPAAGEDEGWVGEKTAKSDDGAGKEAAAASAVEPSPANGKAVVETRTMDVIRKLVMDNRKAARKCYDDARKDQKDLKGDVVIHFVLDPEGKVKLAELNQERSTLKAPVVTDCVLGVIRGIQFPKSSRAMETTTNYPFNFTP